MQIQIQVKREVVASAQATSSLQAAKKYKIEESTIRAWVKKLEKGIDDSQVVRKRGYFQQKYTEQVLIFLLPSQIIFLHFLIKCLIQLKNEVVESAKTISRKEVQSRFNVPGPTIRLTALGFKTLLNAYLDQDVGDASPGSGIFKKSHKDQIPRIPQRFSLGLRQTVGYKIEGTETAKNKKIKGST